MRFKLLGPLSIADGRQSVMLQPSKPTSLLAALLLHPGAVVSTDYLLRAVWDSEPPVTARAALQSCVLRLRRVFAKYGIANDTIEAVPGGYRMQARAETLDLIRFRELVGVARAEADTEAESCLLRQALGLWQSPLLANVASQTIHRDEVPRLTEERLRVLERLCDIELARGRCQEVLAAVWDAARAHPGRERFSEQLIESLYRTGRQTEALVEYRAVKERLKEEFGLDPGASLQRLELAILRGEALGPPDTGARAPRPAGESGDSAVAPPAPEPAPVPCFAGRELQLSALRTLLEAPSGSGLVVISGAPGTGKTALALQAAHQARDAYPGGCRFLAMTGEDGGVRGPAEVRAQLPTAADGRSLIVLDDVTGVDQVRPVLGAAARHTVVVTSRRGLASLVATHGGTVFRLDALDAEESEQLLVNTLGAERVSREAEAARQLADVCGHFPLGLRIAAARLLTRPALSIADCVAWLSADLPARLSLADDPRMSVPRVMESALQRLDQELRAAFLRLAGHDCTDAAGVPDDVLEQLADAGFLEDGPPKSYRIHALLRIYARQCSIAPLVRASAAD